MNTLQTSSALSLLLEDIDGGLAVQTLSETLRHLVAEATRTQKKGEVVIKVTLAPTSSEKVEVGLKTSFTVPTTHGKQTEEYSTKAEFFVIEKGALSVYPPSKKI